MYKLPRVFVSILFVIIGNILLGQNTLKLQTQGGAMFSGWGDVWGHDLSTSLSVYGKLFGLNLRYGHASASYSHFPAEHYMNLENFLVLDEWQDNYPGWRVPDQFDFGDFTASPKTNFYRYQYLTMGINGAFNFKLFKVRHILNLELFGGIQHVEATYIGLSTPAEVSTLLYANFKGVITAPAIFNFYDFLYGASLSLERTIVSNLMGGIYVRWFEGDTRWFSLGLSLGYQIK